MKRSLWVAALATALLIAFSAAGHADNKPRGPILITAAPDGSPANSGSLNASISANGRYVVFESGATNLVSSDTNSVWDVFVRDLRRGVTERVSVDSVGTQGNNHSTTSTISPDGRYVAFSSAASNLVPGDTNGVRDIFLHDRRSGATERISVDDAGNQADGTTIRPVLSADGRYVAFDSFAHNLVDGRPLRVGEVLLRDRTTGHIERVSVNDAGEQAIGGSSVAGISDDGRYVAFVSNAANLVPGPTNLSQVYVRDRKGNVTERVSVATNGDQANSESFTSMPFSMSRDGRYVTFYSSADNLDAQDTNAASDAFVRDRHRRKTTRLSVSSEGIEGNDGGQWPTISADGRYVAFLSAATNLVRGDNNGVSDVFVHDLTKRTTERGSVGPEGMEANDSSGVPTISRNGHTLVFWSSATNLIEADTAGVSQFYAIDTHLLRTKREKGHNPLSE
jgi:Tol biopolymer transport system component